VGHLTERIDYDAFGGKVIGGDYGAP
jgi:hypothetical protein